MDGEPSDRVADSPPGQGAPFRSQLLKWVGSKQKVAPAIISHLPKDFGTYHEPFLGSAGVMAALAPERAMGSDLFAPLIEIFQTLVADPDRLKAWYAQRWARFEAGDRVEMYESVKAAYNAAPNGADFLFLCRACYGGVVRFRKKDGYMSTPVGAHDPIHPDRFAKRVDLWHARLKGATFDRLDYREAMARAKAGDIVYCDPPYAHSQSILYGAQAFDLAELFAAVEECRRRGVRVALSLDGTKKSGGVTCAVDAPQGLFEREVFVDLGRSMLKRFQMGGRTLEAEGVHDRLLLTY
ncbi:MAG: DNA adenine methylase [Rhodobacteraceae bacterium]|nr:DNA adenine methylase [Paracoccaceae bacterium]